MDLCGSGKGPVLSSCARERNFQFPLKGEEFSEKLSYISFSRMSLELVTLLVLSHMLTYHGEYCAFPLRSPCHDSLEWPQWGGLSGRTRLLADVFACLACLAAVLCRRSLSLGPLYTDSRIVPLSATLWNGG